MRLFPLLFMFSLHVFAQAIPSNAVKNEEQNEKFVTVVPPECGVQVMDDIDDAQEWQLIQDKVIRPMVKRLGELASVHVQRSKAT
jgi:hypothetical protein